VRADVPRVKKWELSLLALPSHFASIVVLDNASERVETHQTLCGVSTSLYLYRFTRLAYSFDRDLHMKTLHEAGWLFYDDLIPVDNIIDNNVDHTQRIVRVRFSEATR